MTESGYSLSDIAAATGNSNGNNGMWGNDAWQKSATLQGDLYRKLRY